MADSSTSISDFFSEEPSLSPADLNAVEEIHNRFEGELRDGKSPRLEDFLEQGKHDVRAVLLRCLIEAELDLQPPTSENILQLYLNRFPEYAGVVREAWRNVLKSTDPMGGEGDSNDLVTPSTPGIELVLQNPDEFRDVKYLAEGGFSKVFRAIWVADGQERNVVLKRLKGVKKRTVSKLTPNLNEILEIQGRLDHPGLARLLGTTQDTDGNAVLIEEFVDGCSLYQYLEDAKKRKGEENPVLTVSEAVDLVRKIVEAVEYMHFRKIFHFDLKPANIVGFGDGRETPILVDFGAAAIWEKLDKSAQFYTRKYAAPEQMDVSGTGRGPRSDIFSIGVILYELLTGKLPFRSVDPEAALAERRKNVVVTPRSRLGEKISSRLNNICLKCLQFRPENRFNSVTDLREALESLGDDDAPKTDALSLRPYSRQNAAAYKRLLDAASGSGLAEQIDAFVARILPPGGLSGDYFPPRILALSGPSGSGKSSWFAAGVLPILRERDYSDRLTVVTLDAEERGTVESAHRDHTADELRGKLIHRLSLNTETRKSLEEILADWVTHPSQSAESPTNSSSKLLIVLDQFEQWLSVHGGQSNSTLGKAFQHCDGDRLQVVLIFRSDLTGEAERFMRECKSPRSDQRNAFSIEPLPNVLAMNVLEHILDTADTPIQWPDPTARRQTLEHAAKIQLGSARRTPGILPAWIVMIARYLRKHADSPQQLIRLASFEEIALEHLDELFNSAVARPSKISSLLPSILREAARFNAPAAELRSTMSMAQIQLACSTATSTSDIFTALKELEDADVITCTQSPHSSNHDGVWQVSHEVWLQPIREWLRRLPESKAEKLLMDRASEHSHSPDGRHLLSLSDYVWISSEVPLARRYSNPQKAALLQASERRILRRAVPPIVFAIIAVLLFTISLNNLHRDAAEFGAFQPVQQFTNRWLPQWVIRSVVRKQLDLRRQSGKKGADLLPLQIAMLAVSSRTDSRFKLEWEEVFGNLENIPGELQDDVIRLVARDRAYLKTTKLTQTEVSQSAAVKARNALWKLILGQLDEADREISPKRTEKNGKYYDDYSAMNFFTDNCESWLSSEQFTKYVLSETAFNAMNQFPHLLSAVLKGCDQRSIPPNRNFLELVHTIATTHPDARVHAAACYLLKTWNQPLSHGIAPANSSWRYDEFGILWIYFSIPDTQSSTWVTAHEIDERAYSAVCPDFDQSEVFFESDMFRVHFPIRCIFQFLNHLNYAYHLDHLYIPVPRSTHWEEVLSAPGVRLPRLAECRRFAGSDSEGQNFLGCEYTLATSNIAQEKYMKTQISKDSNPPGSVEKSRRPNPFGISDVIGGRGEIVVVPTDNSKDGSVKINLHECIAYTGGDFYNDRTSLNTKYVFHVQESGDGSRISIDNFLGFHVVCDIPGGPPETKQKFRKLTEN